MILREVVLHNFGPYRGRSIIDLSPSTDGRRPVVLIGALNGGGKTTLLDGIILALYGSRAKCSNRNGLAYPEFLRQSINTRAIPSEGASVSVEFDYVTSRGTSRLRIVRTWRVTGKGLAEESRVYRDGREDEELTETWAERVEDLLPLGISTLFFFDGEQVRQLASSAQATPEVRSAIRTLLGLEIPQQLQNDIGVIATRRRKALVFAPSAKDEVSELEEALRSIESRRTGTLERLGELRNSLESKKRNLEKAREDFTAGGGDLAVRRPELERQHDAIKSQQEQARNRLRELAAGPMPLGLVRSLLSRAIARAREERDSLDGGILEGLLVERDESLVRLLTQRSKDQALIDGVRMFLDQDRLQRLNPLEKAPYLNASREVIGMATSVLAEGRERAFPAAQVIVNQIRVHDREVARIDAQIAASATQEAMEGQLDRLQTLQAEVSRLEHDLQETERQYESDVREAARIQTDIDRKLRELADLEAAGEEDLRVVRAIERVSTVMDEFKRRLLSRKIHEVERLVTERFSHLARKREYFGRVFVNPETFELTLYDVDGLPVVRERLSAGEQQLLAVAFLWALAVASGRNLPIVIDTPLGRMDHEHRRTLVERYFPHASHQVILLSTDAEIDEKYRDVLIGTGAIDREYLLRFDPALRQSEIVPGYFWS